MLCCDGLVRSLEDSTALPTSRELGPRAGGELDGVDQFRAKRRVTFGRRPTGSASGSAKQLLANPWPLPTLHAGD